MCAWVRVGDACHGVVVSAYSALAPECQPLFSDARKRVSFHSVEVKATRRIFRYWNVSNMSSNVWCQADTPCRYRFVIIEYVFESALSIEHIFEYGVYNK